VAVELLLLQDKCSFTSLTILFAEQNPEVSKKIFFKTLNVAVLLLVMVDRGGTYRESFLG